MPQVGLARVLPGAKPFNVGNVNLTFRGQVLLENGSVVNAIIKDLDRQELANELLVGLLAQAVGLPTPASYLALAPSAVFPVLKGPTLPDGNRLVFASSDVMVPNITFQANGMSHLAQQRLLRDILAWVQLGDLYAFDTWVANIDRHPGNLLFGGNGQFWLIDHGQCLTGPAWKVADLDAEVQYRNRLFEWLTTHLSIDQKRKRSTEAQRFANQLALINIVDFSKNSRIDILIPEDKITAIGKFLSERMKNIPKHTNMALGVPSLI